MTIVSETSAASALLEEVVLDADEIAVDRVQVHVNAGAIRLAQAGPEWGDAAIAAFMAERERGEAPVDFRIPNRQVRLPLVLGADGSANFELARRQVQAKTALFQREGGWLKRELRDGRRLYLDVVNATLTLPEEHGWLGVEANTVLVLECIPDFYGDELELGLYTAGLSDNEELIFLEAAVEGDYPGRLRLLLTELSGNDQLGLLWGIRCRHYSNADTARLAYAAEELEPLDTAAVVDGAVEHANLGTDWTPVLSTSIGGTDFLTHTGSYRVWATVESEDGEAVRARFVWDVGDLTLPEENRPITIPGTSDPYTVDLGEIRLDRMPAGPTGVHRWQGQVQARGAVAGEQLRVIRLRFLPLDEGALRIAAPVTTSPALVNYEARDEFNQAAGALTGKALSVGGAWVGAGDADDFTVNTTDACAQRTAVSDAAVELGRFLIAGTSVHTDIVVQADIRTDEAQLSGVGIVAQYTVVARYSDPDNYLAAGFLVAGDEWFPTVFLSVAGGKLGTAGPIAAPLGYKRLLLYVGASGAWRLWLADPTGPFGDPVLQGTDDRLATGGALASGKNGIFDAHTSATPATRHYDNFAAWVPPTDAVLFASGEAELRTDGCYRAGADGIGWGPTSPPIGSLPRIPPSGLEERPVEFFLKQSRGDFDQLPDLAADNLQAQPFYRPSWLTVPG